ncbi:MAG: YitT family protein [Clostridia bacterium]|nr:YitT family protein [Clostridia bacterium]
MGTEYNLNGTRNKLVVKHPKNVKRGNPLLRKKILNCLPDHSDLCLILLGALIQAFGISNIHAHSPVTEGGILGMTLLLDHWLHLSPAISSLVLSGLCYLFAWQHLGFGFIVRSIISSLAYSLFYALCAPFAPLLPWVIASPLLSSLLGALHVGIGAGMCVRAGSAPSGDDALALGIQHLLPVRIESVYLVTDLTVLLLSLSYIPLSQIAYSLLSVIISGKIIGWIQRIPGKQA